MVQHLMAIKKRYMYTGWLQYVPIAILGVLLFAVSILIGVLGGRAIAWLPRVLSILLLLRFMWDVAVVKYGLHPEEPIPEKTVYKDVFETMAERKSCRSFQRRKLQDEDLRIIKKAIEEENSDTNTIETFGDGIRFIYANGSLNVWPVVNAQEFIIALIPAAYDRLSIIEAGRRLERVVIRATEAGIATCWIGPGADHKSIAALMGNEFDPDKHHILCVCAIGYPSKHVPLLVKGMSKKMRRRHPLEDLILFDAAYQAMPEVKEEIEESYGDVFEACRWGPSSFNAQPTRCEVMVQSEGHRFDFFTVKESRFYSPVAAGIWLANFELGCQAKGIEGRFLMTQQGDQGTDMNHYRHYEISWVENVAKDVSET